MKRLIISCSAALMLTVVAGLVPVLSQEGKEGAAEDPMAALAQPGPQHKMLAEDAGDWTIEGKMWMPEGEKVVEMPMTGKSTMKMVYDRYLHEELTIGEGEQAMKVQGFIGYDNSAQEYQCMYISGMGTAMQVYSGSYDEKTKTLSFSLSWTDKGMGNMKRKSRVVSTKKSADEAKMEMYETFGDQPEMKVMEMTYKRVKK